MHNWDKFFIFVPKNINMENKLCKICGKKLPLEMFDEGRHQCKECRKAYRKQRRLKHPEIHRAQATRRQKKQGEWLNSLKTPCIVCGETEPICIDFHHIDSKDKDFTIGKHRNKSKEILLQEINKCVCLCSNCHRKVHSGLINLNNYINESPLC